MYCQLSGWLRHSTGALEGQHHFLKIKIIKPASEKHAHEIHAHERLLSLRFLKAVFAAVSVTFSMNVS